MSDPPRAPVVRLADLPGVACPCGTARRAFAEAAAGRASLHLVEVKRDTERHYHRRLTEIYYVLSGSGQIELDGELCPLTAGDAVLIPCGGGAPGDPRRRADDPAQLRDAGVRPGRRVGGGLTRRVSAEG